MSPGRPPGSPRGRESLLAAVEALQKRAQDDLAHAMRWGWRPGSTAVRLLYPRHAGQGFDSSWWTVRARFEKPYTRSEVRRILTDAHRRLLETA